MQHEDSNLDKQAPILFSLQKKNVHRVPQGFFQELETDIHVKYPKSRTTSFRKITRFAQFFVAAVLVLLVLFSGIKFFIHKEYMPLETIRTIYTVQDGDKDGE
ncbi:MAG: hypothetical protein SH857_17485 [Chitinophagales bacterium]|nr:hypothetical protein [Chitinophagales bacterium]